jgi:NAD-dependent SIR2 family protein deacetylase
MIVKCSCQHCDGRIEFEASELTEENSIVPCPHCGAETKLSLPEQDTPPIPAPQPSSQSSQTEQHTEGIKWVLRA